MNDIIINVGKLIKEKRLQKKFSTQELADLLGVSAGLINNIENGKTDTFNLEFMTNLCKVLDMSMLSAFSTDMEVASDFLETSIGIHKHLPAQVKCIVDAYLDAIIKLNSDHNKLELLNNKVLYEINFISNALK